MGGMKNTDDPIPEQNGSPFTPGESEALPAPLPEGPQAVDFEEALRFTLVNEGGFVDHPSDSAGMTNYGITHKVYSKFLGREATRQDMINMPLSHVKVIYKVNYWDLMNLDRVIDQSIATCMFDMGVLCGTGAVARWVQTLVGVLADGKIGPLTLTALNAQERGAFVPRFADRAQSYFNSIVKAKPSQNVFLKGWTNRANRLRTLAKNTEDGPDLPDTGQSEVGYGLVALAVKKGIRSEPIQLMIDAQIKERPGKNPRYWAYFDASQHSSKKRFYLFDRVEQTVEQFHVAHGSGSDLNHDGMLDKFSNTPGSNCTSKGIYRCAETYIGSNGRSLKLDGKSTSNSNARSRLVVIHGSAYVGEAYVKTNGKCGRSQGCPALDQKLAQSIIDKLVGGSLLYIG